MFQTQIIDNISKQLVQLLKTTPIADIEKNIHSLLAATFNKLHLVTREEFEIQEKVLANTRAKLEELEQKIKELEKNGNS